MVRDESMMEMMAGSWRMWARACCWSWALVWRMRFFEDLSVSSGCVLGVKRGALCEGIDVE